MAYFISQANKCNQEVAAYAYIYGPHNYNTKPFVHIGMDTLIHKKPSKRKTFTQYCVKLWVLGTAMEQYCCCDLWVISTGVKRVSDTVFFKHTSVAPADATIVTADKMVQSLCTHMHPSMSKTIVQSLQYLSEIFQEASKTNKFTNIKLTSTTPPDQFMQQKPQPRPVLQKSHQ